MPNCVMLGLDNKPVPMEDWDRAREQGEICVWDVRTKNMKHPLFPYYRAWLVSEKGRLEIGDTIYSKGYSGGWSAFGSTGFQKVKGFRTMRQAIEYMLVVRGFHRDP